MRRTMRFSAVLALLLTAGSAPVRADVPPAATGADAYGLLTESASHGLHRSGTPGDKAVSDWIASRFRSFGLEASVEEWTFPRFVPRTASLTVGEFAPKTFPLYYSGRTGPGGVTAPLVDVGLGTPADFQRTPVAGRTVLVDVPLALGFFAPTLAGALNSAANGGAVGVVASVRGPLNEIVAQNADSRTGLCSLPTVVVGKEDGAALRAHAGEAATLVLDAGYEDGSALDDAGEPIIGRSQNTIGVLPGSGDDVIVVGTPVNGWFSTAAERGGGVGGLLTLARFFAEAAASRPLPQTLVFIATGGHEVGFLGLERFIKAHPDLVPRMTTYVHMGASIAAKEAEEVAGTVIETGTAEENRALFISENPILEAIGEGAMKSNLAVPMVSVPPRALDPGEQQFMYAARVPIVSISGAHLWFHTERDLPDTTSPELLDPVVKGFRQIVEQLLPLDGATVRAANAVPGALAPAPAAGVCPGT